MNKTLLKLRKYLKLKWKIARFKEYFSLRSFMNMAPEPSLLIVNFLNQSFDHWIKEFSHMQMVLYYSQIHSKESTIENSTLCT